MVHCWIIDIYQVENKCHYRRQVVPHGLVDKQSEGGVCIRGSEQLPWIK